MMDQNAILRLERDDVGHRPKRDQIKSPTQVEIRQGASLEKCVTKFEHDPDATQITECESATHLRIHKRDAIRQRGFGFVMIEHDDVGSAGADFCYFRA